MSSKKGNGRNRHRDNGYGGGNGTLASAVNNAMMNGSFGMLNINSNHNRSETRGSTGDLVVRAGISSNSPAARRRGGTTTIVNNSASVTQVINGSDEPMETVSSTLMRPTSGDQTRVRPNYSAEPSSCGEILGSVTIGEVEPKEEPGFGGIDPKPPCVRPKPIEPEKFQIFVKNSIQKGTELYKFEVSGTDTVADLKELVKEKLEISPDQQRLIFAGKNLEGGTLKEYGIQEGSSILLTARLRGG